MALELKAADRTVVRTALDLTDKAVEAAQKACAVLGVPTLPIDAVSMDSTMLRKALQATGTEPAPTWEVEGSLVPTLRVALRLYLTKLEKVSEAQMHLSVQPDDTQEQMELVRRCLDRATGQGSILEAAERFRDSILEGGSITLESAGREPVTITGRARK